MNARSKDNGGMMYENPRQEKDTHPQWKGRCTIAGVEYWISGWDNEGKKGPYIGLRFQPVEEQHQRARGPEASELARRGPSSRPARDISGEPRGHYYADAKAAAEDPKQREMDDDIPF